MKACNYGIVKDSPSQLSDRISNNRTACSYNVNNEKQIIVATLGPEGTCSENAAQYYINNNHYRGNIELYSTFEEAIETLKAGISDFVIVPSAYRKLADIIFDGRNIIEIADVFILITPGFVAVIMNELTKIKKVAAHSSPANLASECFPYAQLIISNSNSHSANMLVSGEVDACITTKKCIELSSVKIIRDFGEISMSWNVIKKK